MVIWLFSAHNQPYAFCVVTCTHSQCLPHIFITNVVCTDRRSAIYTQWYLFTKYLLSTVTVCFKFQWFPCVVCFLCCVRHYQVPLGNRTAHTYVFIHNSCDAAFSYSTTEPMMVCALCIIICVLCVIFVFALYLDAQRLILNHISPTLPTHTHTRTHATLLFLSFVCLSFSSHFVDRTLSALRCNVDVFFLKKTLRSVTDYHTNTNVFILTCVHARRLWIFYF